MEDWFKQWDYTRTWYHGSPLRLELLKEGVTITQDRHLAEMFSHKPSWLTFSDVGSALKHNGRLPGFLYAICEPVTAGDIYPHPRTVMPRGWEWLLRHPLKVELVGPVAIVPQELLSDDEIAVLKRGHGK